MSAQMLSSGTPTSEPVPIPAINEMQMLEAKAAAASIGGEVKQNISFVRGETQSKAVEESEAQQVITIIFSLVYFVFLTTELQWKLDVWSRRHRHFYHLVYVFKLKKSQITFTWYRHQIWLLIV